MGWTYAFLNLCEPESFHGSYSSSNSPGRFRHWNHFYLEQLMKGYALKKWESTLNLCVHAHGHDVDPIMEASCNNNYFLDIISFGIGEVDPLQLWFWPYVLLWSHFSGKFKHLSSMDQYTSPTFTLIYRRVLHPGISRISWNCITSYGFFTNCYFSPNPNFPGFKVVVNREHRYVNRFRIPVQ